MKSIASALGLCLSVMPLVLHAADPATASPPTLQLGTVEVHGEKQIMQALHVIKRALRTPFSDSADHANDVVCRIDKQLGEAREYLDCATNRDYTKRRDATQVQILKHLGDPGGGTIEHLFMAVQPDHRLHMPVNGGALQALLDKLPDEPAPAAASDTAPLEVPGGTTQPAAAAATHGQ